MSSLREICYKLLEDKGLGDSLHIKRLEDELWQVDAQGVEGYFLGLYNESKKYPRNEHNWLIVYLLGICDDFNINEEVAYVMGEFPDIDIDYLPELRGYLKNDWAPNAYGRENVCNIANNSTFGLKMSILDIARIFGHARNDVTAMTKPLGKDEDGNELNLESAKMIFDDLREFLESEPEMEDAIDRIVGRSKARGKHAGGLIISSTDLSDFLPLVIDSEGNPTSSWTEGQASQDLSSVGLVKNDVLGLRDLERINRICEMVRKDEGIKFISALPGSTEEWSDTSYLNDPKSLALANAGDTTGIFQFESSGMREILRSGGVDKFEDLAVYSALYRPGPMGANMHTAYCDRKQGRQEWSVSDILMPIVGSTYGVLVYQEQIMKVLNVVGDIPLVECETIRKAISKKKTSAFAAAKESFISNGLKKPGMTKETLGKIWEEIEYFSGYGFNKSHSVGYSVISSRLLYLKAHHEKQFYCCTMQMKEDDADRANLIVEAIQKGIKVHPPNFDKSDVTFSIVNGEIYTGLADIKGIGPDIAQEVINNRPYTSYEDFLERFGTSAIVNRAFAALGMFQHWGEPMHLFSFCTYYKSVSDKIKASKLSRQKTIDRQINAINELLPEGDKLRDYDYLISIPYDSVGDVVADYEHGKKLKTTIRRHIKTLEKYSSEEDRKLPTLDDFEGVDDDSFEYEELILLTSNKYAEKKYFGFYWESPLKDYDIDGIIETFDKPKTTFEGFDYVHAIICGKPYTRPTKKGGIFYKLPLEDMTGRKEEVTIWKEDYQKFASILEEWDEVSGHGNAIRILLDPPGKFNNYTLLSQPKWMKKPIVNPDFRTGLDYRITKLSKKDGTDDFD